jgi:hypothetical protein
MKIAKLLPALLIFILNSGQAQDLQEILGNDQDKKEFVTGAFKSTRVIMSHSMEMLNAGVLDFRILHRFGNINQGFSEFFGLDDAGIRLGLDYGISENLTIGMGRSSYRKELDGYMKYRIIRQSTGKGAFPFSVLAVAGTTLNSEKWSEPQRNNLFSSRMGYSGQLIVGRKMSNFFSLQVMPTIVHRNLVESTDDPNDLFAAGFGGRIKVSNRVSLTLDYYLVLNENQSRQLYNPFSIGFDIETGGHVFQLHFTNAIGMNERAFLSETTNNWGKGDFQFGFNISRVFQVRKKSPFNN